MIKNIVFKIALLGFIGMLLSCSENDRLIDELFAETTRGVVLRTVESSIELPEGTDQDFFILLEMQGAQASEADRIDVYLSFEDNTPENGNTILPRELFTSVPASEFITSERLPRTEIRFNLNDLEEFYNIEQEDYAGGDRFIVQLELHMKDGRIFRRENTSAPLDGPFYRSPFTYNANVICPVGSDKFIGEYTIESITPGAFGVKAWNVGEVVTIEAGAGQTNRQMRPTYGNGIGFNLTPLFEFELLCGYIIVPKGQRVGLGCSALGLAYGPAASGETGTYPYVTGEPIDDSILTIMFSDNSEGDCGGSSNTVTAVLIKN